MVLSPIERRHFQNRKKWGASPSAYASREKINSLYLKGDNMESTSVQMCDKFNHDVMQHIAQCSQCRSTIVAVTETAMFKTLAFSLGSNEKLKSFIDFLEGLKNPERMKIYSEGSDE
jgi:hypothetical protein